MLNYFNIINIIDNVNIIKHVKIMINIINMFNMFLSTILPYTIIVATTFALGYHMIKQKKRVNQNKINFSKEHMLVKTLIAIDSFFLICYLPYSIYDIIYYISPFELINNYFYYVSDVLTYIYSSCNLFVLLASNHKFRNYFICLFFCREKPKF